MNAVRAREPGPVLNRSVSRAATILKTIAAHKQGITLSALGDACGLPESTVYRILATLQEEGLVERSPEDARFHIGLEMFRIGSSVLDRLGIGPNVMSFLEELATETGETVNLGTLHGGHVLYLQKIESPHTLRASLTVGSATVPAHCSANGKVLLTHLPTDDLDALLDSYPLQPMGPNSIVDRSSLQVELATIRERGYAVDDLEFASDIRAVGAPIRNHQRVTIAAVAVAAPASRLSLQGAHDLAPRVMEVAQKISRKLGYPD